MPPNSAGTANRLFLLSFLIDFRYFFYTRHSSLSPATKSLSATLRQGRVLAPNDSFSSRDSFSRFLLMRKANRYYNFIFADLKSQYFSLYNIFRYVEHLKSSPFIEIILIKTQKKASTHFLGTYLPI